MMNGFMPSAGAASGLMSGTSAPDHLAPFQPISLRFGSHGLPEGSHEARLYWIRRVAGPVIVRLGELANTPWAAIYPVGETTPFCPPAPDKKPHSLEGLTPSGSYVAP